MRKPLTNAEAEELLDRVQAILGPACGGDEAPHTAYFVFINGQNPNGKSHDFTGSNMKMEFVPALLRELADNHEDDPSHQPAAAPNGPN